MAASDMKDRLSGQVQIRNVALGTPSYAVQVPEGALSAITSFAKSKDPNGGLRLPGGGFADPKETLQAAKTISTARLDRQEQQQQQGQDMTYNDLTAPKVSPGQTRTNGNGRGNA